MEKWEIAVSLSVHSFHVKEKKLSQSMNLNLMVVQPQQKIGI
jgi:hypothetical protein